jgi:hypothetical protein
MALALIPEPKKLTRETGALAMPRARSIGINDQTLHAAADVAREFLRHATISVSVNKVKDTLTLSLNPRLKPDGYRLRIGAKGIAISGHSPAAVQYGVQTLRQIVEQNGDRLPCMRIDDWPDFADRGVYYDICRGRVPTLASLMELATELARYKINHIQLYVEHTFAFRGHPKIGTGASPLSAEDVLELDAYCAELGIELVPSLASFGHMATILKWPEYHYMAEDLGVGKLVENNALTSNFNLRGWTLSPAVPDIYPFLDSLFAEFLPLFRSKRFNICCDETWDLGMGQSHAMCKKKGKGVVYLNHIKKVRRLALKYGKKVQFWGDIIRDYPDLIKDIPSDVTVLDWGYAHNHPFDRIKDFKAAGLPFYACPGTSGWVTLFNRLPEAMANIAGFAAAGHKYGALGLLNTDWGDGGHYNFMEYSWHGYLFGAEQAWNTKAATRSFTSRFVKLFFNAEDKSFADAVTALGDVAQTGGWGYQSTWRHVYFACPGDEVLNLAKPADYSISKGNKIRTVRMRFDAAFGRATLTQLRQIRKTLETQSKKKGVDPLGVLPYWIFAVDTLAHAAKKLSILGPGGRDSKARRKELGKEMTALMRRFEKLWMARNRRSEIRVTLGYYRKALRALR